MKSQQPEAVQIFAHVERLGLKQKDLARALGLEQNKISKVRAGVRQFTAGEVRKAEQWLGNIEAKRDPDQMPTRDVAAGDMVEITRLDLGLSMGPGTDIDSYIDEEPIQFDLSYIRSFTRTAPHWLRIAHGVGESMNPTLFSNDLVWIDASQTTLNQQDRIWAVSVYGAAAIKRLRMIGDGKVLVMSDNASVPDQEVDAEDILIAGRVIRFTRDL